MSPGSYPCIEERAGIGSRSDGGYPRVLTRGWRLIQRMLSAPCFVDEVGIWVNGRTPSNVMASGATRNYR